MLYDARGRPIRTSQRETPEPGTRPPTEAELHYVQHCARRQRWVGKGAVALCCALVVVPVGLGIAANEPALAVSGAIVVLAAVIVMGYVVRREYLLDVPAEPETVTVQGLFSASEIPTRQTWHVGEQEVRIPKHWQGYLREGRPVKMRVLPTSHVPYAVATGTGLSVEQEAERGLFDLLDGQVHPLRLMVTLLAPVFALLSAILPLGTLGRAQEASIPASSPLVLLFMATALLLCVPGGLFFYWHLRARRRIHRMYYEAGVDGAMSLAERRRFRLRLAGMGTGVAMLGGVLVSSLLGLSLFWSVLLFAGIGALFGAVIEEPGPVEE